MATHKVIVTVPARPSYNNQYWLSWGPLSSGAHALEVSDAELDELKIQPVITVVPGDVLPKPVVPAPKEDLGPGAKPLKR